ncbi:MAG: thioredoxin domain-containing protein [Acidimicrobiia bacterium]
MELTANVIHGEGRDRILLLAHGFGADEQDLGGVMPYLDPDGELLTVLPRGPLSAPPGYSWYEIGGDPRTMTEGFLAAVEALDALLDQTAAEHSLSREEAVVGGFSQGAGLALALAMRGDRPHPRAVLVMSGLVPGGIEQTFDWAGAADMPVLVQHGSRDPMIPVEASRQLATMLAEHGVPVVYRDYPMEHQISPESISDARSWLAQVVAGETPSEPVGAAAPAAEPAGPVPDLDENELVPSVTTAGFAIHVLQSELPVIVDFWAPWCQPCRQVSPIVEQIAAMRKGSYRVVKVNIDEEPALAQQFEVQSIPMIGLFRNGALEGQVQGAKPRPQIEAELGMLVIP